MTETLNVAGLGVGDPAPGPSVPPQELNRPIVSVDFDSTLSFYEKYTGPDVPPNTLIPGSVRALQLLFHNGFNVVVYTARETRPVWNWLQSHGLDAYVTSVTNRKPKGHVALFDDSAVPVQPNTPHALLTAVQTWLQARPKEATA